LDSVRVRSFFPGEIIFGYDADSNGIFDRKETDELEEYVFSSHVSY